MDEAAAVAALVSDLHRQIDQFKPRAIGAAKEGLLALSVGVGLGVLSELLEEEVTDVVGPEGQA